jgi:AraC-like DNA-binding protein
MHTLENARPSRELRQYVRGYAQRRTHMSNTVVFQPNPANLETILNFEFGDPPCIRRHGRRFPTHDIDVVGSQTQMCGEVGLCGDIDAFAVFFHPAGFGLLFGVPISVLVDQAREATSILGGQIRSLWNEMGESSSFSGRVCILERFLRERAARAPIASTIIQAANHLIASHGAVRMPDLARHCGFSLRHFERRFRATMGVTPKQFARVARFQMALDTKVASPQRSWLDIAHMLRYHDQMHMIHDFHKLGGDSPDRLIEFLGDMRPLAAAPAGESDSDVKFLLAA